MVTLFDNAIKIPKDGDILACLGAARFAHAAVSPTTKDAIFLSAGGGWKRPVQQAISKRSQGAISCIPTIVLYAVMFSEIQGLTQPYFVTLHG